MTLPLQDCVGAFEAKHAHDQYLRFRTTARRDKLFARWLSAKQHLAPGDAEHLHRAVLAVADGPGHDETLRAMVRKATGEHHGGLSPADLASGLATCAVQAWEELYGGAGAPAGVGGPAGRRTPSVTLR